MSKISTAAAIIIVLVMLLPGAAHGETGSSLITVSSWEQKWGADFDGVQHSGETGSKWTHVDFPVSPIPAKPKDISSVTIAVKLPEIGKHNGLYIDKMYANRVSIVAGGVEIYSVNRSYIYDVNRIIIPLEPSAAGGTLLIQVSTTKDRIGLTSGIMVGPYEKLEALYAGASLLDICLGCAFLLVSLVMLFSSVFLNRGQWRNWVSLSLMIMSIGLLMVTYRPFLYTFYGEYGQLFIHLFDASLLFFLPALTYFFENMFGPGWFAITRKLRRFQIGYSGFCLGGMLLNEWTGDRYYQIYYFFSVKILGIIMIIQFLYIIGSTVVYAVRGNKEAVILTAGIGLFAAIGVGELVWFYTHAPTYDLKWWNFGMIAFIISLIILLGRKLAYTHNRMVHYSKELEIYIQKLQRSEKIEVISQLAASVAHEVRNPLQVSRGFLQLLRERSKSERERGFMKLAIEELDRAANIITDYLSFAKPQLEQVKTLNLAEELKLVHDMMIALADAQGSKLEMNVPKGIFVHGNADKLRQAFINLIKNSLEALGDSGHISLWAYEKNGTVAVHIRDNGEGMDEEMLTRLGEPYFSSKTKGTGLGLMVTFRIIELMNGRLMYKSQKGVGTEAVISLPAVKRETRRTDDPHGAS